VQPVQGTLRCMKLFYLKWIVDSNESMSDVYGTMKSNIRLFNAAKGILTFLGSIKRSSIKHLLSPTDSIYFRLLKSRKWIVAKCVETKTIVFLRLSWRCSCHHALSCTEIGKSWLYHIVSCCFNYGYVLPLLTLHVVVRVSTVRIFVVYLEQGIVTMMPNRVVQVSMFNQLEKPFS
jgi:hypothetical protein